MRYRIITACGSCSRGAERKSTKKKVSESSLTVQERETAAAGIVTPRDQKTL
jgi:hypothetical protein